MSDNGLTSEQSEQVRLIAELQTRRYFDNYLNNVWPRQQAEIVKAMEQSIRLHDGHPAAHGGVERKFTRVVWLVAGAACVGSGGATALIRLLHVL